MLLIKLNYNIIFYQLLKNPKATNLIPIYKPNKYLK